MTEGPKCALCEGLCFGDDGRPLEETLVYQVIDGDVVLAREIVLHKPMYYVHAKCVRQLNE